MKKPKARERILETASSLFLERGYSEVGINEIIAKAETAKASFYQHFPSKQALCEAWLSDIHDQSEVSRKELQESGQTPYEKIEAYFEGLKSYLESHDFRGCPYSNTGAVVSEQCTGIVEQITTHKESIRQFFADVCLEFDADEELAQSRANWLFLLYSGAATEAQNLKASWPVTAAIAALPKILG